MRIRAFRPGDSASLAAIFHDAVRVVGSKYYSAAQIDVWSPTPVPADKFLARVFDGRSVYVAVTDEDKPIGFIEIEEDGHIDCFYCSPEVTGTGIGKALYQRLETEALAAGHTRIYVEASEAARRFFLGRGFKLIERKDFELNNVRIHNYLMEKNLC